MTHPDLYEIHGLLVESELPLEARKAASPVGRPGCSDGSTPDYRIVEGTPRPVPFEPLPGRLLGEFLFNDTAYWACEQPERPDSWVLRYGGLCEAVIDRPKRQITVHSDTGADRGQVSIVVGGGVLAHALTADGRLLFHACAVEAGGRALAIAGQSGSGKSTVAALLCAAGARLVADDALRCESTARGVTCFPGNTVLRLRKAAAGLAQEIPDAEVSSSVDGRIAIRPAFAETPLELVAVLIPNPSHEAEGLEVERLSAVEGLIELIRNPRPNAWRDPETIRRTFHLTAETARSLPVIRVTVPWGPPFLPGLADELLHAMGLEATPA